MGRDNQRTKARLNERIRAILEDGPMRSDDLHATMYRVYGHEKWSGLGSCATMSQTMRQSGMFRRKHWIDNHGCHYEGSLTASQLKKIGICVEVRSVWENKTMDEIIAPFLYKTHTRRLIHKMPASVREAFNNKKALLVGENNES